MISFIHSSDFHLSSSFAYSSLREIAVSRRNDIWKSVEALIDEADKRKIDYLILSGDLYNEEYFTYSDMKRLLDLFRKIENTAIIISPGNHDPYSINSLWELVDIPDNVYLFKKESIEKIEFPDVDIYGFAFENQHYQEKEFTFDYEINPNKINILSLHADLIDSKSPYFPIEKNNLMKYPFDYIALGHIHKPTKISDHIYYPGSIEPLDFGEKKRHGALYGEFNDRELKIEMIPLSSSIFIEHLFRIENEFKYYELEKELEDICTIFSEKIYIRIILVGYLSREYEVDLELLKESLKNKFYYIEIDNRIQQEYDINKIYDLNRSNIIGLFIEEMQEREENEINKLALHLGIEALIEHGEK